MRNILLLIAIFWLNNTEGLIQKNDNTVNFGLYIPKSKNILRYALIESDIFNFTINNEFLFYFDFTVKNIKTQQSFNILTLGNRTNDIQLTMYLMNPSYGIIISLARNNINTIFSGTTPMIAPIIFQRFQGTLGIRNNTMFMSLNNIKFSNILYPIDPSNLFDIKNQQFKITSRTYGSPNYDMIYNKIVLYNRSLSDNEINNLFLDKISTNDLFLYYNFNQISGDIVPDNISGLNLYLNKSENFVLLNTTMKSFEFFSSSVFKKYNFGSVSVLFTINSLRDINTTVNINEQDFHCINIYRNVSTINLEYNFVNLFSCEVSLNTVGVFDIYLSTDNSQSYFLLTEKFTVIQYEIYNEEKIEVVQESIIPTIQSSDNNLITMAIIGVSIALFVLLLLLILIKCSKSEIITNRLIKLDLLYITLKNKNITEIKENSRDAYLGRGANFYFRSSVTGGVVTIFLIILSIFISIAYLNDAINNNVDITSYLNRSGGNSVALEKSFIKSKVNFYNLFYSTCTINGTNQCNNWKISSNNLQNNIITSCQETRINDILTNCQINWSCNGCQTSVGTDSLITIMSNQPNTAFTHFDYEIAINSYDNINKITGNIINDKNILFIGEPFSTVSIITSPTIFNNYGQKSTGFTLDYESVNIGSVATLNDFNNTMTPSAKFINEQIIIDNLNKNTIGVNLKLSRSSDWLFITKNVKNSLFLIFFQLSSIIISVFGLSKIALNFLTKKRILKAIRYIITCNNKIADKGVDKGVGGKSIIDRKVPVIAGSISYVNNDINNKINNFNTDNNFHKNSSIEFTEINTNNV